MISDLIAEWKPSSKNLPPETTLAVNSRYIKLLVLLILVSGGVCWSFLSEFQRSLPWLTRDIQQKRYDWGWDYAFFGKAPIDEKGFQRLANRLGLEPYRPGIPEAEHFYMPSAADDDELTPSWFTSSNDLGGTFVRVQHPYYTIAKYEGGYVYLFRRFCIWDL